MQIIEPEKTDVWTDAVTLQGCKLRLEPLGSHHMDDLEKNLLSPHTWHYVHWQTRTRADLERGLTNSLRVRKEKTENGFAFVLKNSNKAIGMSRLMAFNRMHNSLEIGGTWIAEKWQKTFVNTEAKLLMLTYVFETIRCQRVEFRVDSLNFNSQKAVLRLGAKYEGELRSSRILPDGRKRDYKMYSIIDSEWANIKSTLNWYLDKYV